MKRNKVLYMSDIIDIIESLESSFKISISNEEAEALSFVADVYECVLSKTGQLSGGKCLTQVTYNYLQNHFENSGLEGYYKYPLSTPMNKIFKNVAHGYARVNSHGNLRFPELEFKIANIFSKKGCLQFREDESIESFTKLVLALNFHKFSMMADSSEEDNILDAVKQIIGYHLGVKAVNIDLSYSLTSDLQAD